MEKLSSLLSTNGLNFAKDVLVELGAREVNDLKLVDSDMLRQTTLPPILQKKVLLFCNSIGNEAIVDNNSATELNPAPSSVFCHLESEDAVIDSDGTRRSAKDQHGIRGSIHRDVQGVINDRECAKRSSEELHEITPQPVQLEAELNIESSSTRPSKTLRMMSESMSSSFASDSSSWSRVGLSTQQEQHCSAIRDSICKRLPDAMFTTYEQKSRKREYSYSRLSAIILELAFDANGRWLCHRKCLSKDLTDNNVIVSHTWLTDKHNEAIKLSGLRTEYIMKSDIASCPEKRMNKLIENIILPPECTVTARLFYRAQGMDYRFKIARPDKTMHKLIGNHSNRARQLERDRFREFVKAHRQQNGRTMQKDNRSHGAVYYLDSSISCIRPHDPGNDTSSLVFKFNQALEAEWNSHIAIRTSKPFKPVSATAVDGWMKQYFGSMTVVNGVRVCSSEHTTAFPHKTDACARCEILKISIRSLQQRKKRHEQQSDQGSITRQEALRDIKIEIDDATNELEQHKQEAESSISNHRRCVDSAFNRFKPTNELFHDMLKICRSDETDVKEKEDTVRSFCHAASLTMFDLSSDYQQDKSLPAWNRSPQPGPTYYCSGMTHYVHIFCAESLGRSWGSTRLSRNVVYTRSEAVAGAKVSDDTLSTLGDVLLGYKYPICSQPPLYRTGYDKEGQVLK